MKMAARTWTATPRALDLFSVARTHGIVEGFCDFRPSPVVWQLLVPSVTEPERYQSSSFSRSHCASLSVTPTVRFNHVELTCDELYTKRISLEDLGQACETMILTISKDQLNSLKHGFNGERNLTTSKAVAVHLWRTACKARELADEQDTRLFFGADARARLQPPLPKGYIGNAVVRVSANLQVRALVSKPFELGVAKIEETVNMDIEVKRIIRDVVPLNDANDDGEEGIKDGEDPPILAFGPVELSSNITAESKLSPDISVSSMKSSNVVNSFQNQKWKLNDGRAQEGSSSMEVQILLSSGAKLSTLNYVVTVELGGRKMTVIVDTGSDLTWVQCKPCTSCYNQQDPVFDPSASPSYRSIPCNSSSCDSLTLATGNSGICSIDQQSCSYSLSYGDGSYSHGVLSSDSINLGSMLVNNFIFGCVVRVTGDSLEELRV
ncbi:hypothetical protein J5N97_026879 [Dioscorea zingiberensis]|uniref:Peptidase A1 domain-containing protein n=1 Tax=Dioscorea zingiberensis TaxID=325984 RepID=A0A9D5C2Y6_9LILI|nr:hypothetical protein J5N97_026879 [Dioscorea zingiberensis]